MPVQYLEYQLQIGYVHNWLVAGPQATSVPDLGQFQGEDSRLQIARHFYKSISDILRPPVERDLLQAGDTELTWQYYRCLDDHLVDLSTFQPTTHYLKSWAYPDPDHPWSGRRVDQWPARAPPRALLRSGTPQRSFSRPPGGRMERGVGAL